MSLELYIGIGKPEEKKEIRVESYESKVVFEPKAVYKGEEKKLYTFDESLLALRKRGFERHSRPAEAFDLICRGLEGRLQPEQQAIADDMLLQNYGEWLSMAMKRKGNLLHCYLDPENIFWNGNRKYSIKDGKLKYASEKIYDIQSLSEFVSITEVNKVNPELVDTLWSRPYAILPEKIRKEACLYFFSKEFTWPVFRGGCGDWYAIGSYDYDDRASRGVRLI